MKKTTSIGMALAVTLLAGRLIVAQEPDPAERTLQDEVAELNRTMKTIAGLLEKQVEGQATDLLIRRFEWSSRSLNPKRERMFHARDRVTQLEDEESSLVPTIEAAKEEVAESGSDEPDRQQQLQLEFLERRIETIQKLKRDLGREIVELENEVAAQEEDMRILEDVIDSRLGLH